LFCICIHILHSFCCSDTCPCNCLASIIRTFCLSLTIFDWSCSMVLSPRCNCFEALFARIKWKAKHVSSVKTAYDRRNWLIGWMGTTLKEKRRSSAQEFAYTQMN
jgi:hypothetical protein